MQLVVNEGMHKGTFIPVKGKVFTIGRDETCQLRPRCDEVSRRHAELRRTAGLVLIRDLGSRNGTRVNGVSLTTRIRLRHGDRIEIGPLSFTVLIDDAGMEQRAQRPMEDDVAAWLVGAEEEERGVEDFVSDKADTAESQVVSGRPSGADSSSGKPPADSTGEALDLLEAMSIARPGTHHGV
jgi:pSer/pThr/pTyr-binding forkhead associated (FHA) protein